MKEKEKTENYQYDLWGDSTETNDHVMHLRAPKLPPPTNEESYNPPEEYLLSPEEKRPGKILNIVKEKETSYLKSILP